jgi:hypothetical protein
MVRTTMSEREPTAALRTLRRSVRKCIFLSAMAALLSAVAATPTILLAIDWIKRETTTDASSEALRRRIADAIHDYVEPRLRQALEQQSTSARLVGDPARAWREGFVEGERRGREDAERDVAEAAAEARRIAAQKKAAAQKAVEENAAAHRAARNVR